MRAVSFAAAILASLAFLTSDQQCQAQRVQSPIQGIWDASYSTPWGIASERLILMHTGTFTKSFVCNGKMAFFTGRYAVGDGFIRFVHDRGPIRTETTWFQFQGTNRVRCHDRIMGTTWTMRKVEP